MDLGMALWAREDSRTVLMRHGGPWSLWFRLICVAAHPDALFVFCYH